MPSRFSFRTRLIGLYLCLTLPVVTAAAPMPGKSDILDTMKKATVFMVEKASYQGGYVWSYLPDFSRRWGEMEARESMIWVQPPGTATMGHLFLDAYHISNDEYYYKAAEKAARALIKGQHPSGGWNYLIDFAGEKSIREWYDTIGRNGWRLEEFHHYYGNATFDDGGTAEAAKFLLRLYAEKHDAQYQVALDKVIHFILSAQYPIGGWPQRFPPAGEYPQHGNPDYIGFITFNDDVAAENIDVLMMCYLALKDRKLLAPIIRAMNSYIVTQMPQPQPGWAMQYSLDLKPAPARSYEPTALSPATTAGNILKLLNFYQLTGDRKFIQRIPEALNWLDAVRLPKTRIQNERSHPTFVQLGTNKPLYLHRTGSNVTNGRYYVNDDPDKTVVHYRSTRLIDVDALRKQYNAVASLESDALVEKSPLFNDTGYQLPRFYTFADLNVSDLNSRHRGQREKATTEKIQELINTLNEEGYWPTSLLTTTNPYSPNTTDHPVKGDFSQTWVGDDTDTSPYFTDEPEIGISTGYYIRNMSILIEALLENEQ